MLKLSLRTWIRNAAAVFSGHHGDVTRQAEQSGCSRQTVYQHARKVERRLAEEADAEVVDELRAEIRRLRSRLDELSASPIIASRWARRSSGSWPSPPSPWA